MGEQKLFVACGGLLMPADVFPWDSAQFRSVLFESQGSAWLESVARNYAVRSSPGEEFYYYSSTIPEKPME
jgi:hypothetical protein